MSKVQKEVWKDIPNYEGHYKVSNHGQVKSVKNGNEIIRALKKRGDYLAVDLHIFGKAKTFTVHRLIMLAFVGESDLHVNHINGIKTDNRLENLEYCTRSENVRHAYKLGLSIGKRGEQSHFAKLSEEDARQIKYGYKGWLQRKISKLYGVNRKVVSDIRLGKKWPHI